MMMIMMFIIIIITIIISLTESNNFSLHYKDSRIYEIHTAPSMRIQTF